LVRMWSRVLRPLVKVGITTVSRVVVDDMVGVVRGRGYDKRGVEG
jgi:hypothetical protein